MASTGTTATGASSITSFHSIHRERGWSKRAIRVGFRGAVHGRHHVFTRSATVLDERRKLWTRFHATQFPRRIRDEWKPNRPDVGWYQIRKALEAFGEAELTDFDPFKTFYVVLGAKLRLMVFDLGFLPR